MRGIIWFETFQQGCAKLDEIINNYKIMRIEPKRIIKTKYNYEVIFENNDIWNIAPLCDNSRGKCCNVGYIPFSMKDSQETISIAYPCIKSLPYQAVHFY